MVRQTVTQRSFLLGEMREEFLEADDLETRQQSVRSGLNTRITAARTLRSRPGMTYQRTVGATAYDVIELRPETGLEFGLIINDDSLEIIDTTGALVETISSVDWTSASEVWVEPFREETVIGGFWGLKILTYEEGVWTLGDFAFADTVDSGLAQPYWSFYDDVQIQPSAVSGTITVTASQPIWTSGYVGQRIRYGSREILITGYVSPTVLNGTVVTKLPPSYRLSLASATNFATGDAVVGVDTNFQGIVIAVGTGGGGPSGPVGTIDVATISFFDGPDISEKLTSPRGSSTVSAKTTIAPLASPVWDEPLISPVRGYPRAGAAAAGRLALIDFEQTPDVIAISSVRGVKDFKVGSADDDAIARRCGDNAPRFRHVVNAGDLILFSDRGVYMLTIADGSLLTPSTFNAIQIDKAAANGVRPVAVDDAVVFVEASGESIAIVQLTGNVYRKWKVRTISLFHAHLINSPVKLCGPALYSSMPEKYLLVVNADGTIAAVSWFADFEAEAVGFVPWETDGQIKSASPLFAGYMALVDRDIGGTTARFLERFDEDALIDCAVTITAAETIEANGEDLEGNGEAIGATVAQQTPLAGATVRVAAGDYDLGNHEVDAEGLIANSETFPDGAQAGFNFQTRIMPWPMDIIQSPHLGLIKVRAVRGSVSVLHSGPIAVRSNRTTKRFGGYGFGDDLEAAPERKTRLYKFMVIGRKDHPEIEIIKEGPGAFHVLAINHEVSG